MESKPPLDVVLMNRTHDVLLDGARDALDPPDAWWRGLGTGRVLDVFPEEPLGADSPLLSCPRLLCMPHISAVAPQYMDRYVEEVSGRLAAWSRMASDEGSMGDRGP